MYSLPDSFTHNQVIHHLRFLVRRARARPETAALHTELQNNLKALEAQAAVTDEAREEVAALTAERDYLDELLDDAVANLSRRVLVEVNNSRSAPTYVQIFPTAPSEAMRGVATDAQTTYVRQVIDAARADKTLVHLSTHIDGVQTALDQLETMRALRDEARLRASTARNTLQLLTDKVRAVFNHTYYVLMSHFPGQKSLVRSFYRPRSASTEGD